MTLSVGEDNTAWMVDQWAN